MFLFMKLLPCMRFKETDSLKLQPDSKTLLQPILHRVAEGAHLHRNLDSLLKIFTAQKTNILHFSLPS